MTHEFSVWAPRAQRVDVLVDERTVAMRASGGGWFRATVPGVAPGTRYAFRLDGGPPRPDPRSPSQPDGVHGWSQIVDHGAYAWTDGAWRGRSLRGAVLYELHIGTFTDEGTFVAAIERLPHLVALGVDVIELLPVVEFSGGHGWGYDGVDLFAPHHAYGTADDLKRLIDACHGHGLGAVIDVVYNHLGPSGNYLGEFGAYFSERHRTNWGAAVNFDGPHSDEVRRLVIDNALMWMRDYHVDGLRLDAVHAIVDESALHVLEELAVEVDALAAHLGRPLFLIAESDRNDPRFVRSRDAGGYGLDGAWADEWHHALHAVLTEERAGYYRDFGSVSLLAKALRQAWVYDGEWSPHRLRRHGRSPTGLTGHQFVISTQNHDQVGNRAVGERLSALVSTGRLQIAAALLLTSPFTPMLFQGEEWGATSPFQYFTDHEDPALGEAVRDGRRNEFAHFGWDPERIPDPQDRATFLRSKLDWSEVEKPVHTEMLDWYRQLLELRRTHAALSDPRLDRVAVDCDDERKTLVVRRGEFAIVVNLGAEACAIAVGDVAEVLLSSAPAVTDAASVTVPGDACAIVRTSRSGGHRGHESEANTSLACS
jgi:maltooligosyltrehalose trehalohydrolase